MKSSMAIRSQPCFFSHFEYHLSNPSYLQTAERRNNKLKMMMMMSTKQGHGLWLSMDRTNSSRKHLHKVALVMPPAELTIFTLPTTMQVNEVLHMNGGQGDTSYTKNSLFQNSLSELMARVGPSLLRGGPSCSHDPTYQKKGMANVEPILQDNIRDLYCSIMPQCLKFADLGCSSGPNAFSPLRQVAETIRKECQRLNIQKPPAIQAFLNDLPGNDFNNMFSLLSEFQNKLETEKAGKFGPCFVAGVPGSFHGRLFPDNSIHFFHSSFSINWLSQVPKRLVSEDGIHMNRGNICMAKTSPTCVQGAYSNQFESDFFDFLRSRSEELMSGGRMVIAMMGSNDNKGYNIWELLGMTLNDMAMEGLVDPSLLDSFNIPLHSPCREEVRSVIQKERSFRLLRLETFRLNWDGDNMNKFNGTKSRYENVERGKQMSMTLRAAGESILAAHFGDEITDALFQRHSKKVAEYLDEMGEGMWTNHVISLIKD